VNPPSSFTVFLPFFFFKLVSIIPAGIKDQERTRFMGNFSCPGSAICLQCFDAVGLAAGRASGL